ncbi:PLP-dependent aminotransferase family protein [Clostridium sp.]|uniref:aminotransferase-like domain-containing protein n=1 Tax=Clostridium sp. TaxID=1506 RepID=UPI0032167B41
MYKYLDVLNKIEYMIENEEFKQGEKILSIRKFADLFTCNKWTIIRALEELEKKHIIYSVPQSGYYVVPKKDILNQNEALITDFSSSAPDPNVFPYIDFQHCINQAINTYKDELFIYGTPKGLPSLVSVIRKELAHYQVFANNRNIFITSGVQQALSILASLPFPNNKHTILIEQPGYHLFIEQLETQKISTVGIKRDYSGIDLEELEHIFKEMDIKFFYIMPRYHNPLGSSLSQKDKQEILKLANKYDIYIVEDDFLSDYETDSKADPIYSYDDQSRVIYLKSFSKIIFPGLRVGVAVVPDSLTELFSKYKIYSDVDTSMLSQAALELYIKSGMFEKHRKKMRHSYSQRAKKLHDSLKKYTTINNGTEMYQNHGNYCIHTCIEHGIKINIKNILKESGKNSILISDTASNYLQNFDDKKNYIKLNTSNVPFEYIENGIKDILDIIGTSTT